MRLAIMLTILGTSLCFAADAKDDTATKLQGTWKVVKAANLGIVIPDDLLQKMRVVITQDKLTIKYKEGEETTTPFSIDASKKPPTIDLKLQEELTLPGIYELDKDTLKICVDMRGKERPMEFVSTEKSGTFLLVLEREKK
jgi:uncharacterized protein (TIGR03067 family)